MHTYTYLDLRTQASMHMQTHIDIFSLYKNTHSQCIFERAQIRDSIKGAGYHRIVEYPELEGTHMDHQVLSKIKSGGKERRILL